MSDWPPNPNSMPKTPTPHNQQQAPQGEAWQILEKAVLASVQEQRRSRRWGIFFKFLTFAYLLFLFLMLGRGCSVGGGATSSIGSASPHLAVINIEGAIGSGSNNVNSNDVIESLDKAFQSTTSKAIALNINSPGGSPVQSDEIWQEIKRLRAEHKDKKVYAIIGDMGASGAYYIASAADEIYVNPSSLVGSIGVIMPNYGVTELARKIGVEDRTMTSGSHKALLSPTQVVNPQEKAHVQSVLDNVHQHFIKAVVDGRGKRLKQDTPDIFSGLFWSGDQAIKLGLADKTGSLNSLARELKLQDNVVDYTAPTNPLEGLLGRMGTSIGLGLGESMQQQLSSESKVTLQ
jgi:protease-4